LEVINLFSHLRTTWAEINLDNLAHNMREIRRISKSKDIIAVIKADAYGHGALDVAPVLIENGATRFAVAILSEAIELRNGGIKAPIMILGFTPIEQVEDVFQYDIEQTVYTLEHAKEISRKAVELNKKAKVHIKLDTGMGRIGFLPNEESVEEVQRISKLPNLIIEGLFSHFSSADEKDKEYTYYQLSKFNWFYERLKALNVDIKMRHISNSPSITDLPEAHFEAIRPGIILYGYYPSKEVFKNKIEIKPVMTIKTKIVHIKNLPGGEYISYGREFKTEEESVIATLPIGYADGYTRLLKNKGKVIINGQFAPVIGRICMDQCMIDVTHIEGVKNGDEVIVMGESQGCSFTADDIAESIGTINYEILCMVSKRVPRVYIEEGKIVKTRNYV
jgi:alanine racemase